MLDRITAFISYANRDGKPSRNDLCAHLQHHATHIEYWYDEEQPAGYPIRATLERRILTSDVMIFLLTEGAFQSPWCQWEAELATVREIPVLVIGIHATDPLPALFMKLKVEALNRDGEAWANTVGHLNRMGTPEALIESYRKRMAVLKERAAGLLPEQRRRYEKELAELQERERLQLSRLALRDHGAARRAPPAPRLTPIVAGDVGPRRPARPEPDLDRFAPPPQPVTFCDRVHETDQLETATADPAVRLMVLSGPFGAGKTAVVSRLHGRMEAAGVRLLYLTASGYRRIDPTAALTAIAQATSAPRTAERAARREAPSVGQRLDELLDALEGTRVVLAIDDAHLLFDDAKDIASSPLRHLVDDLVDRPEPCPVQLLLVSTVTPEALLRRHAPLRHVSVAIEEGLDSESAWQFLTSLDDDDLLGLSGTSRMEWECLWSLTKGWPRALELVVGLLVSDPDLTLADVLATLEHAEGSTPPDPKIVVALLMHQAVERMDRTQQRVMHALAIYGRPVTAEAVDELLEPYLPNMRSAALLDQLHRRRLVRRDGHRFYLPRHPDSEQILRLLPGGEPGDELRDPPPLNQVALFSRAADYFAGQRRWLGQSGDLGAHFAEIDLRLRAQQDDTVLDLMAELTEQHLAPAGNADSLNAWRWTLADRLAPGYDAIHNLSQIANACLAVGEPEEALDALTQARTAAVGLDPEEILDLHIQRGDAHFDLGDVARAARVYELAMGEADRAGLAVLQVQARVALMRCSTEVADFAMALEHRDIATALVAEHGSHVSSSVLAPQDARALRRTEALLQLYGALLEASLGRFAPALLALGHARRIALELEEDRLRGGCLVAEALIRTDLGELDLARALATRAIDLGLQLRNPQLSREAGTILAQVLLCAEKVTAAEQAARQAVRASWEPRSMGTLALHGVALFRAGDVDAARKAFGRAEWHGRKMIERDHRSYDIQDYQGLVTCGLVLCGDGFREDDALKAYRAARGITTEERIVRRAARLLRQLADAEDPALCERMLIAATGPLRGAV